MKGRILMFAGLIVVCFGVLGSSPTLADLPGGHPGGKRPDRDVPRDSGTQPVKVAYTRVVVKVDPKATKSVLQIPTGQMPGKIGAIDQPASPGVARSIVAAFAMSFAIFGAFFVRRSRRARAIVAGVVCSAAIVTAAALLAHEPAAADNGPAKPSGERAASPAIEAQSTDANAPEKKAQSFTLVLDGKPRLLDIEEMPTGDHVTLVLAGSDGALIAPARKAAETTPEAKPATSGAAKAK